MLLIKNGYVKTMTGEEYENGCVLIGDDGKSILADLVVGMLSDNYQDFADKIYEIVIDAYGKSALDKNGEASNGSHPEKHSSTVDVEKKNENYSTGRMKSRCGFFMLL